MILSQHTQRLIRNRGMAALYGIAAEHDCDVSDVLDLLVTTSFTSISGPDKPFVPVVVTTPSQPGETSRSHAPAARTDGEAVASQPSSPSVDLSGLAAHEQGPSPSPAVPPADDAADGQGVTLQSAPSAATETGKPVRAKALAAPSKPKRKQAYERVKAVFDAHPDWAPSLIAVAAEVHISTAREWIRQMKAKAGETAPPDDREAKLRAMFENGQPTATDAALALGYIGQGGVRKLAKRLGLEFRPVSKAEVADRIRDGMRHTAARTAKAQTTEALRRATEKPQEAEKPFEAPKAQPQPEQPPATKSVTPRPVTTPNEPRRVVPTHAPVGAGPSTRFYVRDAKGRYLHQSLERSPTDTGPLMTSNRKWAWYDNAQRFAGACRKWPEIADMRKELPNA